MAHMCQGVVWLWLGGSPNGILGRVNIGGVLLLVVGAIAGFLGDRITERWMPETPHRALQVRILGVAAAFAGAFWALYG